MFKISYYQKPNGESPVRTFIESFQITPGKTAQIQYRQIMHSIKMLETAGTRLGERHTKHLEDGIWELRPGCNRVLFSSSETTLLFFCTLFGRKLRKRLNRKSGKPRLNERTGLVEIPDTP